MVDTNIKHGAFVPKQNHKHPCSFCLKESAGPGGVRRLHKYLWYFRQHFPNIGYWEYVSYANNTMLGNSIEKKVKVISSTLSESQQSAIWLASFSALLQVHNSSFHIVVLSNFKPCNGFEFSHSSSLPSLIASHFVEHSLVEQ